MESECVRLSYSRTYMTDDGPAGIGCRCDRGTVVLETETSWLQGRFARSRSRQQEQSLESRCCYHDGHGDCDGRSTSASRRFTSTSEPFDCQTCSLLTSCPTDLRQTCRERNEAAYSSFAGNYRMFDRWISRRQRICSFGKSSRPPPSTPQLILCLAGNHQLHQDCLRPHFYRSVNAFDCESDYSSPVSQERHHSSSPLSSLFPLADSSNAQPEEQQICEYLLKIFRSAVVGLPKTASKFAKDLQQALIPMINKPPPVPAVHPFIRDEFAN